MSLEILKDIINDFSPEKFTRFFREKNRLFIPSKEDFSHYNDTLFTNGLKLGEINFSPSEKLLTSSFSLTKPLSERSCRKAQYDKGKEILKNTQSDAGIFIFYDKNGNFRFSLIYTETFGNRRKWTNFRRFTYFVSNDPGIKNRTFLEQLGKKKENDFSSLDKTKDAFALGPVTDIFYNDFFKEYNKVVESTMKCNKIQSPEKARDFVLLFSVRVIFIGFIQKKGWIGDDDRFLQNLLKEYEPNFMGKDLLYKRWLVPLFFQALNSPPGTKVAYGDNDFSDTTEKNLQMAPYLNGGLFKEKSEYDDEGYFIPDNIIKDFFDFIFSYNFTIEENSYEDEDLQVNPEFLGIIFERLVNKADGAVYTPRTEVDLMCRLSLLKWLQKNLTHTISVANLYELFFREGEKEEDQKQGSFSHSEGDELLDLLENVTICDPAAGSGAFLVGMMQVIDEVEKSLKQRFNIKDNNTFERKKKVIARSLYGVEVKEWAVWICQLRLWLSLFVEAPEEMRHSFQPILPSLDFKVLQGDSLVQRIGSKAFPVLGHAMISETVKRKVTQLKNLKSEYFGNQTPMKEWEVRQREIAIYEEILQSEILEKQKQLKQIKNISKNNEPSLFGDKFFKKDQQELEFDKDKIQLLENEISELVEQKKNIRKDKPLIWNIEFAEIFVESGGFDIVIGNPPYVMYKNIKDPNNIIKHPTEYKKQLKEMVKIDFPNYFKQSSQIAGMSDLYTFFYIRGLRILNANGILTLICSNFWLDVDYGAWLQKFLLNQAPIIFIIDNHSKRSFSAAAINTIISIIEAPTKNIETERLIKFIAFKKPFEEVIFTEYLLSIEKTTTIFSDDIFRAYPITVKNLEEAGTEYEEEINKQKTTRTGRYLGDKWGAKYLKAPDIYYKIISRNESNLVKLGDKKIASICTGIKEGGYNKYMKPTALSFGIKNRIPIIRKPASFKTIVIEEADYAIIDKINSLKSKIKNHDHNILWPAMRGERHYCCYNKNKLPFTGNYFGIKPTESSAAYPLLSLLNSTLSHLFVEIFGRRGFGGGALILVKSDIEKLRIVNILNFNSEQLNKLSKLIDAISKREIKSIFEECGINPRLKTPIEEQEPKPLVDRSKLDKIVFDALDLTEDERTDVYRAVCRLVWNRISKAKSF
jgi:hypothetical protein